jgi:hypothetical protein
MLPTMFRNAVLVLGVIAAGFIGARVAPFLITPRGAAGPSILQSESVVAAAGAILIGFLLMIVIAGIVARLVNAAVGLFIAGAGMFVLDGRLDTMKTLALGSGGLSPNMVLGLLAVEALLLAVLVLGGTLAVFRIGGPLPGVEPDERGHAPHPIVSAAALKSAAAGAIMLLAVALIAQSHLKGQAIAAAFIGAMLAGLFGRLLSPHVQPVLLFASPVLFGAVGYVVSLLRVSDPLDAAFVAGAMPNLSMVTPLDYVAGSLMGVAVGLGWARSFLHHEEHGAVSRPVTG